MKLQDDTLKAFGLKLGLPELKFDAVRTCQLKIEGLKLALYDNRARKSMTILCELSDESVDRAHVETWHKFLLTSQFDFLQRESAVVGINPASGAMVAMSHIADEALSLSQLSAALNDLIDWVLACYERFSTSTRQRFASTSCLTHQYSHSLSRSQHA